MEFQAIVAGRKIAYPRHATFIIERRNHGVGNSWGILAHKENISSAISKFNRAARPGTVTRLSCTYEGRVKPLLREVHSV